MADETNTEPDNAIIDPIRAANPHRAVAVVTMKIAGTEHHFVMTSPSRDERRKYIGEMKAAGTDIEKIECAIEKAALAQIRWPERPKVKELFEYHAGMIQNFAEELAKLDGSGAEVRSKNF